MSALRLIAVAAVVVVLFIGPAMAQDGQEESKKPAEWLLKPTFEVRPVFTNPRPFMNAPPVFSISHLVLHDAANGKLHRAPED